MTSLAGLGAAATLVALAFALCTLERWQDRRGRHMWAWTVSMVMFAAGSAAFWWAAASGWGSLNFRLFYLFGAICNVPWLALGTLWLVASARIALPVERALLALTPLCTGVVLATPLRSSLPDVGIPEGRSVFGIAPRIMAGVGSAGGALVVFAGATWSAVALVRSRRAAANPDETNSVLRPGVRRSGVVRTNIPMAGRLAFTNVCIALGTLILSAAGTSSADGSAATRFAVMLVAGIVVLFAGFAASFPSRQPAGYTDFWADLRHLGERPSG